MSCSDKVDYRGDSGVLQEHVLVLAKRWPNAALEPSISPILPCKKQKVVSVYFTSKQILPFSFAQQHIAISAQRQKIVIDKKRKPQTRPL